MVRTLGGAGMAIAIGASLVLVGPVAAQEPMKIGEVVGGLDSPRGVAIGQDGTIYVAEAGEGGTDPCVTSPELGKLCFGMTGGISAVKDGTATRIVDGLPSAITETGETIGASGVALDAKDNVWYLVGGPGEGAAAVRDSIPGGAGAGFGQLYRRGSSGKVTSVADLAAYETANNPDAAQPGNATPDSNANGLAASPDGAIIADAGANDLLLFDGDALSVLAVFPVVMQPAPPDPAASASPDPSASPAMVPMDPVPTSVAIGPDGAYYVGQLTGFPFPPGKASVFRVVPGEDPTVYATGFTNVMGVAFGPDGTLYVLEIAHDGLLSAAPGTPPAGGLWKVPPGGGQPELITADGLPMPGGIAVAQDGTVYVTTCSVCPNAGSLVSITWPKPS